MIKRKRLRMAVLALSSIMIFAGCRATKETTEKAAEKTYNYSKEYQTSAEHLEDCILEDDTYVSLKDELASYEDKDLKKLSKKDAKALKSTLSDIEEYYEASKDSIQDALVQIGVVYPTEDGFYDDAFKTSTSALVQELNTLIDAGHYKDAAAKLNEITAAYTAYVESKGQTISADISVDAAKTADIKSANASAKSGSKSSAASYNTSGSVGSGNTSASAANNTTSNNNASDSVSPSGSSPTPSGNTTSGSGGNTTTPSAGKNNTSSGGSGNTSNTTYTPTRTPYSWTCPECGAVITGYKGEDDNVNEHDRMHLNEEADAFKYVTDADRAYDNWCASPECDVTISYDTWLDTHGYSSALYHQYCNKYGW